MALGTTKSLNIKTLRLAAQLHEEPNVLQKEWLTYFVLIFAMVFIWSHLVYFQETNNNQHSWILKSHNYVLESCHPGWWNDLPGSQQSLISDCPVLFYQSTNGCWFLYLCQKPVEMLGCKIKRLTNQKKTLWSHRASRKRDFIDSEWVHKAKLHSSLSVLSAVEKKEKEGEVFEVLSEVILRCILNEAVRAHSLKGHEGGKEV